MSYAMDQNLQITMNGEDKMTTKELYELMEDGNLGYACVYKQGDQGMHTDYMFKMTAENIANFIGTLTIIVLRQIVCGLIL